VHIILLPQNLSIRICDLKSPGLLLLLWRYSPKWTLAASLICLHPFRFRAAILQFLHPSFLTSSLTPSSHLNLGRPHLLCLPGLPSRTFLGGSLSSIRATCPAHLSLVDFTIPIRDESPYKSYNSLLNCLRRSHKWDLGFCVGSSFQITPAAALPSSL
jgi:hypothetical protein